jgi:tRNA modification GTPase
MEAMIDFPEDEDVQGLHYEETTERVTVLGRRIQDLLRGYQEGRALRDGVRVALVGKPNVGKSSLLNALLQEDRAIVHETPGTTRDLIEEVMDVEGLLVRVIDTAGIRQGADAVEAEGIRRTEQRIQQSDLVLALFDSSRPLDQDDQVIAKLVSGKKVFRLLTKIDLPPAIDKSDLPGDGNLFSTSSQRGDGLAELKRALRQSFVVDGPGEVLLSHLRHKVALERGLEALAKVPEGAQNKLSLEFLVSDLVIAANHLGEITGEITTDEVLGEIFSRFCLGK